MAKITYGKTQSDSPQITVEGTVNDLPFNNRYFGDSAANQKFMKFAIAPDRTLYVIDKHLEYVFEGVVDTMFCNINILVDPSELSDSCNCGEYEYHDLSAEPGIEAVIPELSVIEVVDSSELGIIIFPNDLLGTHYESTIPTIEIHYNHETQNPITPIIRICYGSVAHIVGGHNVLPNISILSGGALSLIHKMDTYVLTNTDEGPCSAIILNDPGKVGCMVSFLQKHFIKEEGATFIDAKKTKVSCNDVTNIVGLKECAKNLSLLHWVLPQIFTNKPHLHDELDYLVSNNFFRFCNITNKFTSASSKSNVDLLDLPADALGIVASYLIVDDIINMTQFSCESNTLGSIPSPHSQHDGLMYF